MICNILGVETGEDSDIFCYGVDVDQTSNLVYFTGYTDGEVSLFATAQGESDIIGGVINGNNGSLIQGWQFGTSHDDSSELIILDSSNNDDQSEVRIFVTTTTEFDEDVNGGNYRKDWIMELDPLDGSQLWKSRIDLIPNTVLRWDSSLSSILMVGNQYTSNFTDDSDMSNGVFCSFNPDSKSYDFFISDGISTSNERDVVQFLSLDSEGNYYLGGITSGDMFGENSGSQDAFYALYSSSSSGTLSNDDDSSVLSAGAVAGISFAVIAGVGLIVCGILYMQGYFSPKPTYEEGRKDQKNDNTNHHLLNPSTSPYSALED